MGDMVSFLSLMALREKLSKNFRDFPCISVTRIIDLSACFKSKNVVTTNQNAAFPGKILLHPRFAPRSQKLPTMTGTLSYVLIFITKSETISKTIVVYSKHENMFPLIVDKIPIISPGIFRGSMENVKKWIQTCFFCFRG